MKQGFHTFSLSLLLLLTAGACHREIPVDKIEILPRTATLFVGETCDITVNCFPEEATNLDELLIYSANESIIKYQDGTVTATGGGKAAVTASCGSVLAQSIFTVYKDKFTKGNTSYGIDYASGYLYTMGGSTVQELEIILVNTSPGGTQNFKVWLKYDQLGQQLDYTKPLEGTFVGVYANNNENGYLVYSSSEGTPMIVRADWSSAEGVTLRRGILQVDDLHYSKYRVHADFELSDGFRFSADWEGSANMEYE